jgi:hypothetical protein
LEQQVPKDIVELISKVTWDERVSFDFKDFDVIVCAHDDPKLKARIPLWDGMTFYRSEGRIETNRIIALRVQPITLKLTVAGDEKTK